LLADLIEDDRGFQYFLRGQVKIFKIKSHLTLAEALAKGHSQLAWQANRTADVYAERGARQYAYSEGDIQLIRKLDAIAGVVVRRLCAVARFVLAHRLPPSRVERNARVSIRQQVQQAGEAGGHCLYFSSGVGCKKCRQHSRMRYAASWASKACPGPGTRHGHKMQCIHGLYFCTVCGQWATAAGASSRGMHQQCSGHAAKRGRELLARLACQPPRLPDLHGRRQWPDGTPAAPPTALAAAVRKRRAAGGPSSCTGRAKPRAGGGEVGGRYPRPPLLFRPAGNRKSIAEQRLEAVFARVRARSLVSR
jgi:hypothetical protein